MSAHTLTPSQVTILAALALAPLGIALCGWAVVIALDAIKGVERALEGL